MNSGWQTKKLGELCQIELGKTPARATKAFWDERRQTSNVWLSIADLLNAEDNIVVDSKEYLSDRGASVSKTVPKGTLLVSFKLTLGRLAFAGRDLFTNEAIAALTIFDEGQLSKEFLFWFLHAFDWRKAAENDVKLKGMTLNKAKLREMPVSFPLPAEQHRIVGILDDAFAAIAAARANTERNLRNARETYERELDALFADGAERWGDRRVGDLAEIVTKGTTPTSIGFRFEPDGPVNFVKVEAISTEGTIHPERLARISVECHEALRRSQLRENDVLFSIAGALGRTAIVRPELLPANTNQALAIIRLKPSIDVLPEFLVRALATSVTAAQTDLLKAGAAQQNLSLAQLRGFEVPVPTRAEQELIVERLRGLRTLTLRLTRVFDQKLAALDALKQSMLHQAFTGAL